MIRDWFFKTVLKGVSDYTLQSLFGGSPHALYQIRDAKAYWHDVMRLCQATGTDMGIALRLRNGQEITFFPSVNFGSGLPEDRIQKTRTVIIQPRPEPAAEKPAQERIANAQEIELGDLWG